MSDLGPDARALLDAAAGADDPSVEDRRRVRAALTSALAAGTTLGVVATLAKEGAVAQASSTAMAVAWSKVVTVIVVATTLTAGALEYGYLPSVAPKATSSAAPSDDANAEPAVVSPSPLGGVATAIEDPPATPDATPISSPLGSPRAAPSSRGAKTPAPAASAVTIASPTSNSGSPAAPRASAPSSEGEANRDLVLGGETTLIRATQAALDRGDGIEALALIEAHARRYPNGLLVDEREAQRILALCTVGKVPAAQQSAESYLAAHPRSRHTTTIKRACGL